MKVGGKRAAVTNATETAQLRAAATLQENPLSVLGLLGDDVDDPVDRVGPPLRGPRSADDFNPIDVFQERILRVPKHSRVQRRIDRAPVDQHQHFVGQRVVESARTDGPLARVHPGHLQVRGQAQGLGDAGRARATNVLFGDDLNG